MHLGLVCPEVAGHLNPSLALGRALASRGHRVSVITAPRVHATVERAGLEPIAIGEPEEADGSAVAALDRLSELTGLRAVFHTARLIHEAALIGRRDLPNAIRQSGLEGLIVDQVHPAAAIVAEELRLPYAVICNALAFHFDPFLPPPALLWRSRPNLFGRLRSRLTRLALVPLIDAVVGAHRSGISPLMLAIERRYGLVHVAQQPAFFDFPWQSLPDNFHYTAPWHTADRDDEVSFPWEWLDGRPLIYASLGTIQNRARHVYAAIVEAARQLDAQFVLTLGRRDASLDVSYPKNVMVVPYAPQLRMLDRAAVAITHAGLNTALECLCRGVPMLCLPITNDQPGVARRVERLGAGRVLPIRSASPRRLREGLLHLLSEATYRDAARKCQTALRHLDGPTLAADVIERALTRGERVLH